VKSNPYQSPASELVEEVETKIMPSEFAESTRIIVARFGIFQFAWPFLVLYWTDAISVDLWALIIATNGNRINQQSFKRFPWTALMCCLYPLTFIGYTFTHSTSSVWVWLPARFSPVLLLHLVASDWAVYAIYCIVRCHRSHANQ